MKTALFFIILCSSMSILFDLYTFIVKNQNSFNEKSVIIHDDRGFESPWVPEPGRRNFGDNIPRCIPVDEVIKVLKNVKADDFKSFEEAHIIMKKANERGICK